MSTPTLLTETRAQRVLLAFINLGDVDEREVDRVLGTAHPLTDREIVIAMRTSAVLKVPQPFALPDLYDLLWTVIESGEAAPISLVADALEALEGLDAGERESLLTSMLASLVPEATPVEEFIALFEEIRVLNPEAADALLAEMREEHEARAA